MHSISTVSTTKIPRNFPKPQKTRAQCYMLCEFTTRHPIRDKTTINASRNKQHKLLPQCVMDNVHIEGIGNAVGLITWAHKKGCHYFNLKSNVTCQSTVLYKRECFRALGQNKQIVMLPSATDRKNLKNGVGFFLIFF